jgi:GT2 family glycosyltransferase
LQHDAGHNVLVVIPVYGHHEMTHELLRDLAREEGLVEVVVVDNGGDYPTLGGEDVIRPSRNLGWAEGTNRGTRERARPHHLAFLWLNNDTRLSAGFVAGLLRCWRETGAAIVGPVYDCHWLHQQAPQPVPVEHYRPRGVHHRVPFLDGTAMLVAATTVDTIGVLDADTFAPIGWGAEIDYGLRARDAGLELAVTRLSYLHHEKSATGRTVFEGGLTEYAERGFPVAMQGLERKWGADWRRRAGIDSTTHQTRPPDRSSRLRSGVARWINHSSASRSPSSRSR